MLQDKLHVFCCLIYRTFTLLKIGKELGKLRQTRQQTRNPSEKYSHKNGLLSALTLCLVIMKIRSKETLIESYTRPCRI